MTVVTTDEKPKPVLSTQEASNPSVRAKAQYTGNVRKSKFAAADDDSLAKNEMRGHVSTRHVGEPNQTCKKEYIPAAGCSNTSQKPTPVETRKKSLVREAIQKFSEK